MLVNEGYVATSGNRLTRHELCREAIRLCRILVDLLPGSAEAQGLLTLMLLHGSRRNAQAPTAAETDWDQISLLYDTLAKMTPSVVIEVNRAVAVALAKDPQQGLQMLLRLENEADNFYPYHAARADLLRRTNQREAAADAYQRALDLCGNSVERTYLQRRLDEMVHPE